MRATQVTATSRSSGDASATPSASASSTSDPMSVSSSIGRIAAWERLRKRSLGGGSTVKRGAPASTVSPSRTAISLTTPSIGEAIGFSIFMASTITTG